MKTDRLHDIEHAAIRALADARSFGEVGPQILKGICQALGWSFGALWRLQHTAAGELLICTDVWRRDDVSLRAFEQESRQRTYERGVGIPGRIWETGRPAWIHDVVHDSNFPRAPVAAEAELRSAVGFPIFVRGDFAGVIEFFSREMETPDDRLLDLFTTIGDQIGRLIDREEIERQLQFHAAILEAQGEAAIDGILILSTDNRIVHWNERFLEIWRVPDELLRRGDIDAVVQKKAEQSADPSRFILLFQTLTDDPLVSRRDEIQLADGRVIDRWAAPVRGPDETLYGRALFYRDITTQKRSEQRLRESERWFSFLAEVGTVMSERLDYRANLERLARMVVPMLADWCSIHIVDDTGAIEPVALAHRDQNKLAAARQLQEMFPVDPYSETGLAAAVRGGTSLLIEDIREEMLKTAARDEDHLEHLQSFGFRSCMIVPLICRDHVLGTLTLVSAESGRRFTKEDLRLAEDLAARAAFPIDNARLYEQHTRVAKTLQESLLPPELPEIPGVELAARYHAVVQTADVGGDFYDVFPAGERSWGLALGDVSGKGVEAAAVTSLARHTLRAATMATQRPSEILSMLNAALLEQTEHDRFCTAVYALVEPRFGHVNVTVACGGHPMPYVIRSSGTLEPVACEGTLLGVVADPELTDISLELDFGDKLILYTDGVLDVRPREGDFGHRELEQLFAACSKRGVKAAAELIEKSVLELQEGQARDDFAIMLLGVRASIFRRVRTPRLWGRARAVDELDISR